MRDSRPFRLPPPTSIPADLKDLTVSDLVERAVGNLKVRIDRSICVGFEYCTEESSTAFRLGDYDVVEFVEPEKESRERLIAAASVCPVAALSIVDPDGYQLAP